MAPHQERGVNEKIDLDDKIDRLTTFITGDFFKSLDRAEKMRLETQLNYMRGYSTVLGWRIAAFAA